MQTTFPEDFKIVTLLSNVTDGSARTGDWITLKTGSRVTIVCEVLQGAATAMDINPMQATAVAGTSKKALATACRIWANADTSASDTLVRATDAVNYDAANTATGKLVVFEIDPTMLDLANDFDCLTIETEGDSASNLITATAFIHARYGKATPPTAITD